MTGRTVREGEAPLPGTVPETAAAIDEAGGRGIAVPCDHSDDAQVEALFKQVEREQDGRLDILVNNATFIHDALIDAGNFWEKSLELVDILDIGLRSAYVASYYAAPLMVRRRKGLICFSSSFGGNCYMHGPAYGAQKVGIDKFAADMAVELRDSDVAAVSIWLGPLRTARTSWAAQRHPGQYDELLKVAETPEFTGKLIAALYNDPELMEKSGQALIGAELGELYGIRDEGGRQPPSYRERFGSPRTQHPAVVR